MPIGGGKIILIRLKKNLNASSPSNTLLEAASRRFAAVVDSQFSVLSLQLKKLR